MNTTTHQHTTGDTMSDQFQTGDHLAYEDMANPRRVYEVMGHWTSGSIWNTEYRLRDVETGERITSDCRQRGWVLVARPVPCPMECGASVILDGMLVRDLDRTPHDCDPIELRQQEIARVLGDHYDERYAL